MRNATNDSRFCYVCKVVKSRGEFPEKPFVTRWGGIATRFIGPCRPCYESGHYWSIKTERKCDVCMLTKPASEFYRHAYTTRTGKKSTRFMSRCKGCHNAQAGLRQSALAGNPDHLKKKREYNHANRDRLRTLSDTAKSRNPAKTREYQRKSHLKIAYGITPEQYEAMLFAQGGKCATCDRVHVDSISGKERLHVDHCHDTGKVRGLLCHYCNIAAGMLGDNPETLKRIAAYLELVR